MLLRGPVLFVKDPWQFDYVDAIRQVIQILAKGGTSCLDIAIGDPIKDAHELNRVLNSLYFTTRKEANKIGLDYRFDVNVLYNKASDHWTVGYVIEGENVEHYQISMDKIISIEANIRERKLQEEFTERLTAGSFRTTAVGGTFDHLHDGHKILLSMTTFLTSMRVIVGITGPKLLENKTYVKELESFEYRTKKVAKFIQLMMQASKGSFALYEINDICGPTGSVLDIDALVVSQESIKGGAFVNNYRKERGMPELYIFVIDVVDDENRNDKISSTTIRRLEHEKDMKK